MKRLWVGLAMAIGLASITAGGVVVSQGGGAAAGTANLWVDANGGSCTRSGSAVAYADGSACDSFGSAYVAATSGDKIGVTGTLGDQWYAGGAGCSSNCTVGTKTLTWEGAAGNKVRSLHFGSVNQTFDGLNLDADAGTIAGGTAQLENGGASFTFKNGTIGDTHDSKGALATEGPVTFDNVDFHDVVLVTEGVHTECMQTYWAWMTVKNSTFTNCAIMDISFGTNDNWEPCCGLTPPITGVILENNTFGTSRTDNGACCASISLALWSTDDPIDIGAPGFDDDIDDFGEMNNWIVRNNTLEDGSSFHNRLDNVEVGTGNITCGNVGAWGAGFTGAC